LLLGESFGHAVCVSAERLGDERGASASALYSRPLGTSASDSLSIPCIGAERWIKRQHGDLDFRLPPKGDCEARFPVEGKILSTCLEKMIARHLR